MDTICQMKDIDEFEINFDLLGGKTVQEWMEEVFKEDEEHEWMEAFEEDRHKKIDQRGGGSN